MQYQGPVFRLPPIRQGTWRDHHHPPPPAPPAPPPHYKLMHMFGVGLQQVHGADILPCAPRLPVTPRLGQQVSGLGLPSPVTLGWHHGPQMSLFFGMLTKHSMADSPSQTHFQLQCWYFSC